MLNIILFGAPGSGKGTQAEKLIKQYGLLHLSTGDLLRQEINQNSALGIEAKKYMDIGQLVPDAVVINMIAEKIKAEPNHNGIIFDGFPRTQAQAEALDILLEQLNIPIQHVIYLQVEEQELIQRLLQRGLTSGRSDDNDATIKKRIIEYNQKTQPLTAYYQQQGKLRSILGMGSIDDIFLKIIQSLQS